jgi:16S rRNA (cytidine1402-2'-O)-methyltransferase
MPGISDPGAVVIRRAVEEGLHVEVLPGPSAVVSALVVSGLPTERFVFEGFLPRKGKERTARLLELSREPRTIVLYEAPHRLRKTLSDLREGLGPGRRCAVARELTKKFEEVIRGTLADLETHFEVTEPRGEICVVLEGAPSGTSTLVGDDSACGEEERLEQACVLARQLRQQGKPVKEAAKAAAAAKRVSRNDVYQAVIKGENGDERK